MLYWVNQFAVTPDQPGGTRHYEMSRELIRGGVPTTVVASDLNLTRRRYMRRRGASDPRYLREALDDGAFVWLPAGFYQANDWRRAVSMVVFALHSLWFLLRAPMPSGSVVIGSSPHLLGAAAARLAALVRRVPFILEVRDLWPESLEVRGDATGLTFRALRVLADVLYRTSPAIVMLAAGNRAPIEARGISPERLHYVPNGVDPDVFANASPTSIPDLPHDREAFVYAGAHGPANGLETVLDAAEKLMEDGERRAQLVLIGDGPSKLELMASAERRGLTNVTFLDPVAKAEIPGILKGSAGGLMPLADVELFSYGVSPNKLFDYLSADLPVITNVPGDVARMVTEANAGIVVPPSDASALASAVVQILDGSKTFSSGLDWIRERHDRTRLAHDLATLVRAMAR